MAEQLPLTAVQSRPMTLAHQALAACLAVYCMGVTRLEETDAALIILRDVLPHAHGDGVTAQALVKAGRAVADAHQLGGPKGIDWLRADEAARFAVRLYYRQRAAAAHAKIYPETQMPPNPSNEAAHAAE